MKSTFPHFLSAFAIVLSSFDPEAKCDVVSKAKCLREENRPAFNSPEQVENYLKDLTDKIEGKLDACDSLLGDYLRTELQKCPDEKRNSPHHFQAQKTSVRKSYPVVLI
jgi:hypothetical protein